MPGLMFMLPLAFLIALAFLGFFLWSVRNGDYEDIEMQKYRVLLDDADDADHNLAAVIKKDPGSELKP